MKVQKDALVALEYTLTIDSGEVVDKSEPDNPLHFIFGIGQMLPGLESEMSGMVEGDTAKITLEPEDAYGPSNPELYRDVPRESFPPDAEIEAGAVFQAMGPHGAIPVSVHSVQDDTVTIDLNHPLAGQRLHFDIKVGQVREPTPEEVEAFTAACSPTACAGCGGTCH
jgi:FKBP-type peptidyl-prolyl cis-trans isomerase SlyD